MSNLKEAVLYEMFSGTPLIENGELSVTAMLENSIRNLDKAEYRKEYKSVCPELDTHFEVVPMKQDSEIVGMKSIKYKKEDNGYKTVVLLENPFTKEELKKLEMFSAQLKEKELELLAEREKEFASQKGKRAAFINLDFDFTLDIKPDFTQMAEVPVRAGMFDFLTKGRTGISDIKLYLDFSQGWTDFVFVFETDRGTYVMLDSGFEGFSWSAEQMNRITNFSITIDDVWSGTFNIDNAKTVEPVEFFRTYEKHKTRIGSCKRNRPLRRRLVVRLRV